MIDLHEDRLTFRFPELHKDARLTVAFQRTLRIPDDNRSWPLPPGLGDFPLSHVDDYAPHLPAEWAQRGGVFFPMYQAEAMWVRFSGSYPMAVEVAAGKVNAVTGEPWTNELDEETQDYVVVPEQPWLDGFCVDEGMIRQFVAMPLGEGYTAEEQITGEAQHGGLQIVAYPMKKSVYLAMQRERRERVDYLMSAAPAAESGPLYSAPRRPDMGLAPGGLMRQEIYDDPYEFDVWDTSVRSRCFVHILNSARFLEATGTRPPHEPVTARDYSEAGLPWFEYYNDDLEALSGAPKLATLDSVAAKSVKVGDGVLPDNEPVYPHALNLPKGPRPVRDGDF